MSMTSPPFRLMLAYTNSEKIIAPNLNPALAHYLEVIILVACVVSLARTFLEEFTYDWEIRRYYLQHATRA